MDCSLRSETLVPLANLPVGKSFKAVRCTKRTTDLESFRQKRLGAVSGTGAYSKTHEGNTRADAPRRRVNAESHGFKTWECVNSGKVRFLRALVSGESIASACGQK
jgi:hypothetical protein